MPAKVIADISVSLDGYVTGPDPDAEHGLGIGGEALHDWALTSDDPTDAAILAAGAEGAGAVLMGRRLFDIIDGPNGWNDEMGYGAAHATVPPVFVLTHTPPERWRLGPRFRFVTGGLAEALPLAREAAGAKFVSVMGGGEVVAQAVLSGAADELVLHIAPVVLGGGTPLFPAGSRAALTPVSVQQTPHATHVTYAVGA